jgi:glucosyl-dolichyl phosphate glucuronosyltransferase
VGPSIGVVICAYTEARWAQLAEAVRSVQFQSHPACDVVVAVDHNDSLLERARLALEPARVIASDRPAGLSGARNAALAQVGGSVVAFLDDDARAAPDWLEQLAGAFADPSVMGAGGWIAPRWEGPEPRWLAPELYWIVGCSYRGLPPEGAELRNPIGANMAFRRSVLAELGGFREGMGRVREQPLGDEETELGIQAHARWPEGHIVHVPAARVEHVVPRSRASVRYLLSRCWAEGRSKALLAKHVQAQAALQSERWYVARALPAGVVRGLRDALHGDRCGLGRAASILGALAVTALGYASGRLRPTPR